jgi:hypothetical protein
MARDQSEQQEKRTLIGYKKRASVDVSDNASIRNKSVSGDQGADQWMN